MLEVTQDVAQAERTGFLVEIAHIVDFPSVLIDELNAIGPSDGIVTVGELYVHRGGGTVRLSLADLVTSEALVEPGENLALHQLRFVGGKIAPCNGNP